MAVAVFFCFVLFCLFLFFFCCLFVFYYYFHILFTSVLTPRVIQNHITRVFIYKSRFKLWKKNELVLFHFLIFLAVLYIERVFVLIWHRLSPWLFHEYLWFFTLYSCRFSLKFNSNLHTTIHCFLFLHFRGTSHIAESRLSTGKAGFTPKNKEKKKKKKKKRIDVAIRLVKTWFWFISYLFSYITVSYIWNHSYTIKKCIHKFQYQETS